MAGEAARQAKELPAFQAAEGRALDAQRVARVVPGAITDEATLDVATEALGAISSARRGIEEQRKLATGPARKEEAAINAEFKELVSPISAAEQRIKDAILAYQRERREKAEAERKRQERLARERQAREDKRAAKENRTAVEHAAPPVPIPANTVKAGDTKASVRVIWKFRIINPAQVPAKYLKVDEVEIGKAVRGGEREIAGVEIYPDEQLAVSS